MSQAQAVPGVRVVVLAGYGGRSVWDRHFGRAEIRIGRAGPNCSGEGPDVDLSPDRRVSRDHARVRWQSGEWTIEDRTSKTGTTLDGREIKGQGPVRLAPGTPVQTGGTTWTVIPGDWLFLRHGDVVIYGPCRSTLSYAAFHCGVPPIDRLTAWNVGTSDTEPVALGLEIVGFSDVCSAAVPSIAPCSFVAIPAPATRLHIQQLRRMVEPARTALRILADGSSHVLASHDLTVLGFWDWPLEPTARRILAAFVSPRDPMVVRVVQSAGSALKHVAGTDSYTELLKSAKEDAETLALTALYRTLAERFRVRWLPPEAGRLAEFGETYQTIRSPSRIFGSPASTDGQATCLDLALLAAGCLESIGLCPVVVLLGGPEGNPRHALSGCWLGTVPGDRPVVDDVALIRREVASGRLVLVEWTGLAEGVGKRLCFPEAVARAEQQVADSPWLCMVDIKALRPPIGCVTPLDTPWEPEAARARDQARQFATARGRRAVETTYLLYGLVAAGGQVIRELCSKAGLELDDLRGRIESSVAATHVAGEPVPTRNCYECWRYAEDAAWSAGVRSVREQDVLWAVLIRGRASRKLRAKCQAIGIDLERLSQLLAVEHLPPDQIVLGSSMLSTPGERAP